MREVIKIVIISLFIILSCSTDNHSRLKRLESFKAEIPSVIYEKFPSFSESELNKAIGLKIKYEATYKFHGVFGLLLYYDLKDIDNKTLNDLKNVDLRNDSTSFRFKIINMEQELIDSLGSNIFYVPEFGQGAFNDSKVDISASRLDLYSIIEARRIIANDNYKTKIDYKGYTIGTYVQDKKYFVYWILIW